MAICSRKLLIVLLPIFANLSLAMAATDVLDLSALEALYGCLGSPQELAGWSLTGGDPCGEDPWRGVTCSGQSVISINISGLGIGGFLCSQISSLRSLKKLDASYNNIGGEIPYGLPLNVTHINLAMNNFNGSIPHSLPSMEALSHLNVSHNSLSGPVGNVFTDMQSLEQLDLSFNHFTGDLPTSFGSLTGLHVLHLENNEFTGSVILLANLPLSVLNLKDNHFSGYVPKQFELIPKLRIDGNLFQPGFKYPHTVLNTSTSSPLSSSDMNVSHIPEFNQLPAHNNKKRKMSMAAVAGTISGVLIFAILASAVAVLHIYKSRRDHLARPESSDEKFLALPISSTAVDDLNQSMSASTHMSRINLPSVRHLNPEKISRRKSCSRKSKNLVNPKLFSASELFEATKHYSEENILGEGSIGCVYKAEFPDGLILAVKKINTVALAVCEEDEFLDVIWNMSRLRHPNISTLIGYCVEEGEHILVYDYARNGSLDDVLSSEEKRKDLSWKARVRIALGVVHAIEYMHSICYPPVTHGNIKARNILLDDEHTPYLSDCGLTMIRHLINTMPKASDAISFNGYAAPELNVCGADKSKIDVYSFGVVLLELLTGRSSFDSSKTKEEQFLVEWASSHLHDFSSLEGIVDPVIKGTIPFMALSRFADIILMCIQPEPNFRPPMTEVTESMLALVKSMGHPQEQSGNKNTNATGAPEVNMSDQSFKSTVAYLDPPFSSMST